MRRYAFREDLLVKQPPNLLQSTSAMAGASSARSSSLSPTEAGSGNDGFDYNKGILQAIGFKEFVPHFQELRTRHAMLAKGAPSPDQSQSQSHGAVSQGDVSQGGNAGQQPGCDAPTDKGAQVRPVHSSQSSVPPPPTHTHTHTRSCAHTQLCQRCW